MSIQQRKHHLTKVHSLAVVNSTSVQESSNNGTCTSQLAMTMESAAKGLNVPLTCVEGIWRKATGLISDINVVVPDPGQSKEAQMVLSYSGKTLHLVTPTKGGGYNCDKNCSNWKSIAFSSHTVVVAHINDKRPQFVAFLQEKKKTPNLTQLVTFNMPRGRGRKGGIPLRQRKSTQAPSTRIPMTAVYLDSSTGEKTPSYLASFYQPPIPLYSPGYSSSPCSIYPVYYQHQFPGIFTNPGPFKLCFKETFLFVLGAIIVIPSHLNLQKIYALNIKSGDSLHLKEQTCLRRNTLMCIITAAQSASGFVTHILGLSH